ncbi:MAG TPA: redoxin domain-containing protein [Gemmatimonadaceae bacterium]
MTRESKVAMNESAARIGTTPAGCLSAGTGMLFPDVTLPTPDGMPVSLGQYRGRRNLVVVLLGAGAPDERVASLLGQLAQSSAALDEENAKLLVIRTDDTDQSSMGELPSVTVLVDEDGAFHRSMGAVDAAGHPSPALYITDLYREIYLAARPGESTWPENAEAVQSWLVFMNIQCPECNVPEW